MASFKYSTDENGAILVFGREGLQVAILDQLSDGQWLITPGPTWILSNGFNFGPFATEEEALAELDAQ